MYSQFSTVFDMCAVAGALVITNVNSLTAESNCTYQCTIKNVITKGSQTHEIRLAVTGEQGNDCL